MVKLSPKISGCFRTITEPSASLRVRSYISTAAKQGQDTLRCSLHSRRTPPGCRTAGEMSSRRPTAVIIR